VRCDTPCAAAGRGPPRIARGARPWTVVGAGQLGGLHRHLCRLRALTYSIRAGKGPFGNISVGGEHLHHYLWGIGLLSGVGAVPSAVRSGTAVTRQLLSVTGRSALGDHDPLCALICADARIAPDLVDSLRSSVTLHAAP
jgi:hypothetical protein